MAASDAARRERTPPVPLSDALRADRRDGMLLGSAELNVMEDSSATVDSATVVRAASASNAEESVEREEF